jgi:hypothetical protein
MQVKTAVFKPGVNKPASPRPRFVYNHLMKCQQMAVTLAVHEQFAQGHVSDAVLLMSMHQHVVDFSMQTMGECSIAAAVAIIDTCTCLCQAPTAIKSIRHEAHIGAPLS